MSDYWKNQFNKCIYEVSHCYHCKFGGAGWKDDYKPFYFCGPHCIYEFNGLEYNSSDFDSYSDEDEDYESEVYDFDEDEDEDFDNNLNVQSEVEPDPE
jgi:hypothetical protein